MWLFINLSNLVSLIIFSNLDTLIRNVNGDVRSSVKKENILLLISTGCLHCMNTDGIGIYLKSYMKFYFVLKLWNNNFKIASCYNIIEGSA